ncbi:hypothetical protein [Bacillus sp. Cr_A10]|uniref:DUF6843 domain-containing protein n=1 Tax=Bacillus sp. Cr_A10 TaxID=3033993 RepID=UPI0023DAA459|nr:hypothetical protein [Bacillus sp. Cr_A10]MDF2066720.1 hypothetical protein [Bacillus sp. Cr_A10]
MKWKVISLILMLGIFLYWLNKQNNETSVVYHLPEDFKGCINIYFNQPNEKELEIIDDTLLFVVPEHGNILTSSSHEFIVDLGWYKEKAF